MADPQDLAAHRQRRQILSVVQDNRVTMIVGDTGCGKSTQVPKILLDQVGGRVLCTQPRRLAVVAVASRVAEELGEELGGSVVGYHIGQDARAHEHTKLVFSTIGIALEQIKSLGLAALTRYSCIIVDEVHERSAESDVVLACIRQLAPHAPLVHGAAFKDWNAIRSQGLGGHAPCRFWTRAPRKGERMFGMPRAPDVLVYVRCLGSGLGDP